MNVPTDCSKETDTLRRRMLKGRNLLWLGCFYSAETYADGLKPLLKELVDLGVRIWYIFDPLSQVEMDFEKQLRGDKMLMINSDDETDNGAIYVPDMTDFSKTTPAIIHEHILARFQKLNKDRPAEKQIRLDGVFSPHEVCAPLVGALAELLHLPGNPLSAYTNARNKLTTRELLKSTTPELENLGNIRFAILKDDWFDYLYNPFITGACLNASREKVEQHIRDIFAADTTDAAGQAYPFILKPSSGAASMGVSVINNLEEFEIRYMDLAKKLGIRKGPAPPSALPSRRTSITASNSTLTPGEASEEDKLNLEDALEEDEPNLDYTYNPGVSSVDIIMEEFIVGDEFDVDLLLWNGEICFASANDNWPTIYPSLVETGSNCPSVYPDHILHEMYAYVKKVLARLGFSQGCFHVEMKYHHLRKKPILIEVNPRMGGGRTSFFYKNVFGINLFLEFIYTQLGIPINPYLSYMDSSIISTALPKKHTATAIASTALTSSSFKELSLEDASLAASDLKTNSESKIASIPEDLCVVVDYDISAPKTGYLFNTADLVHCSAPCCMSTLGDSSIEGTTIDAIPPTEPSPSRKTSDTSLKVYHEMPIINKNSVFFKNALYEIVLEKIFLKPTSRFATIIGYKRELDALHASDLPAQSHTGIVEENYLGFVTLKMHAKNYLEFISNPASFAFFTPRLPLEKRGPLSLNRTGQDQGIFHELPMHLALIHPHFPALPRIPTRWLDTHLNAAGAGPAAGASAGSSTWLQDNCASLVDADGQFVEFDASRAAHLAFLSENMTREEWRRVLAQKGREIMAYLLEMANTTDMPVADQLDIYRNTLQACCKLGPVTNTHPLFLPIILTKQEIKASRDLLFHDRYIRKEELSEEERKRVDVL